MEYTLTAEKRSDLLAILSAGRSLWTFDMAIDRTSLKSTLEAAGDTDTITLTDREKTTIKTVLQYTKVSESTTDLEFDRYCALCVDFE